MLTVVFILNSTDFKMAGRGRGKKVQGTYNTPGPGSSVAGRGRGSVIQIGKNDIILLYF